MFHRAEIVGAAEGSEPEAERRRPEPLVRRPQPGAALDVLLDTGPGFPIALRGYDRMHVDNYVAWAEGELLSARREADDLMARYGRCAADLEISRRLLAQSREAQEMTQVSDRIGTMLRLAADEAARLTAAGAVEAERVRAEARVDADARLHKAHEIKQVAVATADRMREEAQRVRDQADAELERARAAATVILDQARAEADRTARAVEEERRERELAASRAAAAQVAALQAEIDDLHEQRTRARESLRRLTCQIDDALSALAVSPSGNVAVLATPGEGDVAVLADVTGG